MMRRAPRPEQQIHLVLNDQLFVDLGCLTGIGLIVVGHKLDHALGASHVEAATGVHLIAPKFIGIFLRWRRRGIYSGERQRKTDPNGIGGSSTTHPDDCKTRSHHRYSQFPHVSAPFATDAQSLIGAIQRTPSGKRGAALYTPSVSYMRYFRCQTFWMRSVV